MGEAYITKNHCVFQVSAHVKSADRVHGYVEISTRPSTHWEGSHPCRCMECGFLFISYLVEKETKKPKTRWPDIFTTTGWIPHIWLVKYCHIVKLLSSDWSIARCCMEENVTQGWRHFCGNLQLEANSECFNKWNNYVWNITPYKQVSSQLYMNQQLESISN